LPSTDGRLGRSSPTTDAAVRRLARVGACGAARGDGATARGDGATRALALAAQQAIQRDARHVLGGAARRSIVDRLLLCLAGCASGSPLLIWLGSI